MTDFHLLKTTAQIFPILGKRRVSPILILMKSRKQTAPAARAARVMDTGNRDSSILENGILRVMINDKGGMVPELSARYGNGYLNAHWIPDFRSNSGARFDPKKHGDFWKADLLYSIAGNFPCSPNFGPGNETAGVAHPPHGWAANLQWRYENEGIDEETGAAWASSTMKSPDARLPLRYRKLDLVVPGHPAHYTSMLIENAGTALAEINVGWHNTVGSPFLETGCRVSVCAESFATAPQGGEFDATGRLAIGAEFRSLAKAPLRTGKRCDLRTVPGMIGYTDFVTGPVPAAARVGWSAVVNPRLALVYLCWFPGPAAAEKDEIALSFNDLWMQYGGRSYTPWAAYDGGTDRSFCLGTENAVGAFANGLSYATKTRRLLGAPTTLLIPPRSSRRLRYATLFAPYASGALDEGVSTVHQEKNRLVVEGNGKKAVKPTVDADFSLLRQLEARLL